MRTTEGIWLTYGGTPCASCSTRGGYVRPGESQPSRTRGCCATCYKYHRDSDTLDQFLTLRPAHTAPEARVRLRPVWQRRDERQDIIAAVVAIHEGGGLIAAAPLVEGFDNRAKRMANAERFAAAYLGAARAA